MFEAISLHHALGLPLRSVNALLWQLSSGGALAWLPLVFIFAIFYFLLIMPQQRRQKKWQAMLGSLKNGDKVVTQGGISGTIIALRDEYVHLRVPPDNIKLEVSRSAVVSVVNPEQPVKT